MYGLDQVGRLDAGQHRQRQLGADAADRNQPLEQILLETGRKTEEQQRVLAHVGVNAQRDLRARVAEPVEGGQRHGHVIPDAVDVDDDPVRLLVENASSEVRDHERSGL